MMGWSPKCYILSFKEFGLPVPEEKVLAYMGVAAILVRLLVSSNQIFFSLYLNAFIQTLVQIGTAVSEKILFKFCMYMIMGLGQEMTLTFNTHISSHIQLDVCYYLLSFQWLQ